MDDSKKEGYIAGAILLFLGVIFIIVALEQGIFSSGKITGIFGLFSTMVGVGSFLNPKIAEVVVHWMKGQQKTTKISQNQHKPKNSPQIGKVGSLTIHYGEKKNKDGIENNSSEKSALVEYEIASILPGTVKYDLIDSGKVWFWIKNNEDKKYKAYIEIEFTCENYHEITVGGYYGGGKEWNLNAFMGIRAPGMRIPPKIIELAKEGKSIEIKIDCTIKDENNKIIEKKLPVRYVYNKGLGDWCLEP